jgi:hypothetical protein
VLGAASQTVTMSGTTIWVREDLLPLRDLPVVEPDVPDRPRVPDALVDAITPRPGAGTPTATVGSPSRSTCRSA